MSKKFNKYSEAIIQYMNNRDKELLQKNHNFVIFDIPENMLNEFFTKFNIENVKYTICRLDDPKNIVQMEDNQTLYDILYGQELLQKEVRKRTFYE